jgi:3'-phosphoadenosine 5'-phosphosulfate sulfotransferase (PAPS reductase)/FAD synthetase
MSNENHFKADYLDQLESEAVYILREAAGQFEQPALLFSGGNDSITLVSESAMEDRKKNGYF